MDCVNALSAPHASAANFFWSCMVSYTVHCTQTAIWWPRYRCVACTGAVALRALGAGQTKLFAVKEGRLI